MLLLAVMWDSASLTHLCKTHDPGARKGFLQHIDILDQVCYNKFLREQKMSEAQTALYAKLAQLQLLTDLDDDAVQEAISALAQTIEDVVA